MPIEGWEPFREMTSLREAMDRLFQDSFVRPRGQVMKEGDGWFPIDVADREDQIEIRAEIPGLKPEQIQIGVQGDTLTIRGEQKEESERKEDNWVVRERRSGSFLRSLPLPSSVDAEKSNAKYENGVLTLTLPKKAEAKAREIKVTS